MNKKTLFTILEWSIAVAAYVYLGYKLATYEHYDVVADSLRSMGGPQWLALVLSVALMPVNMALEAWRWKTLIPMPWPEAQRQVYYSKLAGLITPWRLGEYPARGMLMVNGDKEESDLMTKVLAMGAIGSATMTMAIVIAGLIALAFSPSVLEKVGGSYLYALIGVVAVLGICLYFAPQWLKKWFWNPDTSDRQSTLIWQSLGQSAVRLACWCVQLGLVIFAFSSLNYDVMTLLRLSMVYYLLVTVTPNIPIVEAGVRGAWAMMLFGSVNAALAGVVLWVINTLLPCLIWLFFRKKKK